MSSTPLHLMAVIGLAIGFGAALTMALQVQTAGAYPAGPSISAGSNPIVSAGGSFEGPGSEAALSAPDDQDLIITDVILTASDTSSGCVGTSRVALSDGSTVLAQFSTGFTYDMRSFNNVKPQLIAQLGSGIRVAAGRTLTIQVTERYELYCSGSGIDLDWTVSGYHAQP